MSKSFGPAGIFSTDDPQADARQIMCEQFDDQEDIDLNDPYANFDLEDLEFDFECPSLTNFTCCCSDHSENCPFFNYKLYATEADRQTFIDESQALHSKLYPECKGQLIVKNFSM